MKSTGALKHNKYAPEFSGWLLWLVVGIFFLNNFYFKHSYNNWLTGKLSDFAVCFFLPLYCAAALKLFVNLQLHTRLLVGCLSTLIVLSSLKLSETISGLHDIWLNKLTALVGLSAVHNNVDASDLIALPILYLAYCYGRKKNHDFYH